MSIIKQDYGEIGGGGDWEVLYEKANASQNVVTDILATDAKIMVASTTHSSASMYYFLVAHFENGQIVADDVFPNTVSNAASITINTNGYICLNNINGWGHAMTSNIIILG